jgi:hypothetical protein
MGTIIHTRYPKFDWKNTSNGFSRLNTSVSGSMWKQTPIVKSTIPSDSIIDSATDEIHLQYES